MPMLSRSADRSTARACFGRDMQREHIRGEWVAVCDFARAVQRGACLATVAAGKFGVGEEDVRADELAGSALYLGERDRPP